MIASGHAPTSGAPSSAPVQPRTTATETIPGKPAHILVAQLEEEETARRKREAERMQNLFDEAAPEEAIAQVQVATDTPPPARRLPEWVWGALLVMVVVTGLGYAYTQAYQEPEPIAAVDPEVVAAAARKKEALTALNNGHEAVLDEKHDAAIRYYRRALRLEPDLASAERGLGIAYAAKGNRRAALKHYQRFIQLEPDSFEAAKVKEIIRDYRRKRRR